MDMVGLTTPDAWSVYAHHVHHLGLPSRVYELPDKKPPPPLRRTKLDVAMWTPMGPGSTAMLCTLGGCNLAMSNGGFAELFLLARPAPSDTEARLLARFLRKLLRGPRERGAPLVANTAIAVRDDAAPMDRFAGVLLMPPVTFNKGFEQVRFKNGKRVDVLWTIPLHEAELAFAVRSGAQALMDRLGQMQVDLARLDRPSALAPDSTVIWAG